MISGHGAWCPFLEPLPAMMKAKMSLHTSFYDNGDGLLTIPQGKDSKLACLRLSLTDSGHYLLPCDEFGPKRKIENEEKVFLCVTKHLDRVFAFSCQRCTELA